MKKLILISVLAGAMPLMSMAQDDDLYFTTKPSSNSSSYEYNSGRSNRDVDEYNRRYQSTYQAIGNDTTGNDVINFSDGRGVYPQDSIVGDNDYRITRRMSRFDGYNGYDPYYGWADPYYSSFYWGSPYYGWSLGWGYNPWYYSWYDPWYYGGYYGGCYGYYDPWYYGGGYYRGGDWYGGGSRNYRGYRSGNSTILSRNGGSFGSGSRSTFGRGYNSRSSYSSSGIRSNSGSTFGGNSRSTFGRSSSSSSRSFSSSSSYTPSSSYSSSSSSSFGGSSRSSSGGGSFGGGGGGGSFGGGGGGGSFGGGGGHSGGGHR
jgi:hypothetical protein